jgi:hypothetical protein
VRKCLGVLAGVVALSVASWAQAPAQTPAEAPSSTQAPASTPAPAPDSQTPQAPAAQPPQAPSTQTTQESSSIPPPGPRQTVAPRFARTELFAGYSFAQAGFFNAGHWAQLNGWNASFAVNLANWFGFVGEGSEYFGTSKIPTGTPAPFPPCQNFCPPGVTFNVDTREYNVLFGAQFPWHKYKTWTPFGEVMFGHDGVRGVATLGTLQSEVSSGLALVAGAGADHKINERFALRVKVDYLQSRTDYPRIGKAKQDNLRVSVGVVIRSVRSKKRRLEDETQGEQ